MADLKPLARKATPLTPDGPGQTAPAPGLSKAEAARRLQTLGPNDVPDATAHPWRRLLRMFWAPVPWMLEVAIAIQVAQGDDAAALVIASLLVFNAAIGLVQEGRARHTLTALKSRLALMASVRRDGVWLTVAALDLVPDDIIKLSLGGVVAADVRILEGSVLIDQSMLTGESIPIEIGPGLQTYAGALVRRGEALAVVTSTGARTKFGRTAELVRDAHVVSAQQKAVVRVVRNLAGFNGLVIVLLTIYAYALHMPHAQIIPLVLTAILASIPVALPATFTLASALGASALAKKGVLCTRLSAVDEAAAMDVLCADKTGTLTRNELSIATVRAMPGFDESYVLALGALASSQGGQDPVDTVIRQAAQGKTLDNLPHLVEFVPFDPSTKMAEAKVTLSAGGGIQRVIKGAFSVISPLAQASGAAAAAADELAQQGLRVLAVAMGPPTGITLVGLIALSDPPRQDAAALITELSSLGVHTVMVTGDALATAVNVAHAVGMEGQACPAGPIPADVQPQTFAVFAGVLPQTKYELVKVLQTTGHTVGMCGDGANDAPALRQAQIGIAVSTATDVAKSAAGMVLVEPGLAGIVAAVKQGRVTFQRILTYTLNSIVKKLVTVLFLIVGLIMTGHPILTPMQMVIIMITGDFLAMSLTTDNVRPSPSPNVWRIGNLTIAGVLLGLCLLAFCAAVLAFGHFELALPEGALSSLAFAALIFGSQAMIYSVRERARLWHSRPSNWLMTSSCADVLIATVLSVKGIAMAPLSPGLVAGTLAAAAIFALVIDLVRVRSFARLQIA